MLPDISKRIEDKVRATIKEHRLIEPKQHIVIGLSGGPDSVCLFNVLIKLSLEMELTIHPVHVNHKFRPGAAEHDQKYVEELSRENGLICHSFVVDCNKLAQDTGTTSEEAGRNARYEAFYQVAEQIATDKKLPRSSIKIAVAQNANDQAETLLFRLIRGTGTDGLAGIAYRREERGYEVIRPVLDLYRYEIEEYCLYNKLDPVTDHTNGEAVYARNKIRLELLPYLEKEYNKNIMEGLVRLSAIAAEDKEFLWQQADEVYNSMAVKSFSAAGKVTLGGEKNRILCEKIVIDREKLAALHPSLRHRVMAKVFGEIGLVRDVTRERILAADRIIQKKQAPKTVQFPNGYMLTVAKGNVIFSKQNNNER